MDALAEVHNEETRLRDAGLLQSATVLATRSSSAHPATHVPLVSPLVVRPAARGESVGLHCDHCGRDGHVEAFCYRKKKAQKAQAHHSYRVLVILVLKDLRGVLLVQRHRRFSCCFVALRLLRRQELLVL
jgi:hypothetical protein